MEARSARRTADAFVVLFLHPRHHSAGNQQVHWRPGRFAGRQMASGFKHVSDTFVVNKIITFKLLKRSHQAGTPTLQQCQTNAILTLLNLNQAVEAPIDSQSVASRAPNLNIPTAGPPVWKILVLDQTTKDVLATVLRVQDLRDIGVTLHV